MVIIIPDIHGRQFWKDAVKDRENEDIIFLGDYMDPYEEEEIGYNKALENFKEIIAFANEHKNVTLLLGNHDIHYLFSFLGLTMAFAELCDALSSRYFS